MMDMTNKNGRGIVKKYEQEILNIKNILTPLKNGRIKELTGYDGDGYLGNNIRKLETELNDLLHKIEFDKSSINDDMSDLF